MYNVFRHTLLVSLFYFPVLLVQQKMWDYFPF